MSITTIPSTIDSHTITTSTTSTTAPSTTTTTTTTDAPARTGLWRSGAVAGAVAAVATTLIVVAARAADVPVAVKGEQIPLAGFAQFTIAGAVLGVLLAKAFRRRARHPQRTFVRTTVALTVLSLVPDVAIDATTASKLVLMLTHVVAASIIVPALAARLQPSR